MGSIPATSALPRPSSSPDPHRRQPVKKFMLIVIVLALGAVVAKKKLAA
ncbi:MAG: hypothetical protein M3357_14935 [Actinomycetota bacterium]|nr:hypothetical protein [Actinomycetota bacterium]